MYDFTGEKRDGLSRYALFIAGCMVWACMLFAGCKKKASPTSTQYGYISYTVQWDSIPRHCTPNDILRFCFYPADNGPMIQTDTDSGTLRIALAPGKYGLLVYNYGKDNFQLRNRTRFDNMEVAFKVDDNGYSKSASIPVYGTVIQEFEVMPNQDVNTIISPIFFTKSVYFKINIPQSHQKQISDCKGTLSGVSPLLSIPNRTIKRDTTTTLTLPFEKNKSGFEGQTLLLDGTNTALEKISHKLTLLFTLNNGKTIASNVDMGSGLLDIKHHDILVNIDTFINTESEPEINLTCESINVYSE